MLRSDCCAFLFTDTATTEIYTLSLHDALPILHRRLILNLGLRWEPGRPWREVKNRWQQFLTSRDRKSTRLNSSHTVISYAVFCLKKKKQSQTDTVACCPASAAPQIQPRRPRYG